MRAEALAAARAGGTISVIAPAPHADPGIHTLAAGGTEVFSWPGATSRLRESPWRAHAVPGFVARGRIHLTRSEPDEIVCHWLVPSFLPVSLGVRARVTVVCHGADVRLLCAVPRPLRSRCIEAVLDAGAHVRFVASSLQRMLLESLPSRLAAALDRESAVSPPSVDVSDVTPTSARAPYAIVASRLIRDKKIDVAVRATQAVGLRLVVIGDGPDEARLRRLGHGRFRGRLGRRETLGLIAGAQVMLHPSAVDAAPTSVLEARALGVPVVSFGAGDVAVWARRDPAIHVVGSEHEMTAVLRGGLIT